MSLHISAIMRSAGIILLCNMLGLVHSITVTMPARSVNVTEGGTVLLACMFTTTSPTTSLVVQWTFNEKQGTGQPQQVVYYQGGTTVFGHEFQGRVKLLSNPALTKNATISIDNMQQDDTGMFTCEVDNIPDIEGRNEMTVVVNVLVKPSVPYCSIHGEVETGHRVTLSCHSKEGNPPPTYTWTNMEAGAPKEIKGTQDIKKGTLVIQNISEVQFGEYQCVASNGVGAGTCMIDLSEEINDGIIAGAVIGALLICGAIGLLIWAVTHHLKKTHKMKVTKSVKESEMQPMKASSATHQGKEDGDEDPAV
ncbi:V-set and immunoglobulin domain-containing protein 1-like [Sardina pilchardus]|uniref:V-set and immunoglobulin domain-containing protein 1-like n=1 Tax=Sardina pilchardus TaxID=27697 RepID=UPI002E11A764